MARSKRLFESLDLMDWFGAGVLMGQIQQFWHDQGHTNVTVERVDIFGDGNTFGIRSNLINGLPPSSAGTTT